MANKISSERKVTYYIGIACTIVGFILFISSFFSGIDNSSPMNSISTQNFSMETPSFFKQAVVGMILIIVGAILIRVGSQGLAGSGIVLDPEKAREDLKPFNEVKGKMINDVVENIDVVNNLSEQSKDNAPREIIKVKCRECGALNDEDAKFCKECGKSI